MTFCREAIKSANRMSLQEPLWLTKNLASPLYGVLLVMTLHMYGTLLLPNSKSYCTTVMIVLITDMASVARSFCVTGAAQRLKSRTNTDGLDTARSTICL